MPYRPLHIQYAVEGVGQTYYVHVNVDTEHAYTTLVLNLVVEDMYMYWVRRNSTKFSDGGIFFRYLLWVLRLLSSDRLLACIRAIPYGYSGNRVHTKISRN
eukprot:SAG11_NODE_12759_length_686_cov_1.494037_1_plen_101_part_00